MPKPKPEPSQIFPGRVCWLQIFWIQHGPQVQAKGAASAASQQRSTSDRKRGSQRYGRSCPIPTNWRAPVRETSRRRRRSAGWESRWLRWRLRSDSARRASAWSRQRTARGDGRTRLVPRPAYRQRRPDRLAGDAPGRLRGSVRWPQGLPAPWLKGAADIRRVARPPGRSSRGAGTAREGGSSRITCALVPPMPNELTPARSGASGACFDLATGVAACSRKGAVGEIDPDWVLQNASSVGAACLQASAVLMIPAMPAAVSR